MLNAVLSVRRNAGGDAPFIQGLSEGSGTISPVGEQESGGWQLLYDSGSGLVVVGLPLAQMQQQRASPVVAHHLQLAGQAAPAASDTSG